MGLSLLLLIVCLSAFVAGIMLRLQGKRALGAACLVVGLVLPLGFIIFLGLVTGTLPSVWPPATQPLRDLFKTPVPASVRVVHYKSAPGNDPWFWWEVAPVDDAYLQALVRNAALKRSTPEQPAPTLPPQWPVWWKAATPAPETLPEAYYSESGEDGLREIWVDRKNQRLFIVFLGT